MSDLKQRHCTPCEGGTPALEPAESANLLKELDQGWSLIEDGHAIERVFSFKNYYQTMGFVNAVAWIAHTQDHHPDLEVGYNRCRVRYSTHAIGGLSENDFICAARVDELLNA
ncbi:MAG: 4a-hydroxytetrahydrobiopterin dehydratase [Gammaproteobacteria bacterium]|jgi:4a-hydroxytetrahydrobiopterin dehydratase